MSFSLLRYFDGAKSGEKRKSLVSIDERAEENKKRWKAYEVEKRDERGFQEVWKKGQAMASI
ncbi:hypothetical protein DPMN_173631 [Dreissena polymorpha]|uniref:Uncharacterized protein n=1 Tax=Dreissena polymorpha TaxID=45954 RepID=A0A9D4IHS8_DREPO|nr:hypothetical protein DPMN_173631 [Dreissena polymorpha]